MSTARRNSNSVRFILPVLLLTPALAPGLTLAQDRAAALAADPAVARAVDISDAFKRVARDVTPAVVSIMARGGRGQPQNDGMDPQDEFFRRFFGDGFPGAPQGRGPQQRPAPQRVSTGSGVIVAADGYVLTNNHVVEGATDVQVTLADDRVFSAKVVGTDPPTDLAVLKIEGSALPYASLGDSDTTDIGEWVVAIGNPFNLAQTVTAGIISGKGRQLDQPGPRRGGGTRFEDFLQTDAAINPGNSGGPLVNLRGEVIGINTAIFTRSGGYMGIGFAVPANMAKMVMQSLIDTGTVERGYLGVTFQEMNADLARSLNFKGDGVLVTRVEEDSPAAKAGLQVEDVITAYNGRPITTGNGFRNAVAATRPGTSTPLEVFREGETRRLEVTLAKRDEAQLAAAAGGPVVGRLGIAVRTLTPEAATEAGDARLRGVVVSGVEPDSPGAQLGLMQGDIVTHINRTPVTDADAFRRALDAADAQRGVRLRVVRDGVAQFLTFIIR